MTTAPRAPKPVSREMWEEIANAKRHASSDYEYHLTSAILRIGQRNGFTEQDLIDAQLIADTASPTAQKQRAGKRLSDQ
jgi:hypothetical protein